MEIFCTLNPSRILPSDYHDVSANRTRHFYATLFTALVSMLRDLNRDSEGFHVYVRVRFTAMDFLRFRLAKLQKHLAFVQVDPIYWIGNVQGFS